MNMHGASMRPAAVTFNLLFTAYGGISRTSSLLLASFPTRLARHALPSPLHRNAPPQRSLATHPTPTPTPTSQHSPTHHTTDVLIIGSGCAGLSAALRCHLHGLQPLLIEKSTHIGGTTAWSGGGLWVPLNAPYRGRDVHDSEEAALRYLEGLVGGEDEARDGRAASAARRRAYVRNAHGVVAELERCGVEWVPTVGMPDYHGEVGGSVDEGRSIEPALWNVRRLGEWRGWLREASIFKGPPMHIYEGIKAARVMTVGGWGMLLKILARWVGSKMLGRELVGMGRSLVAQLLMANVERGTEIWRSVAFKSLRKSEDGRVIGAVVERDGQEVTIDANAVVLAAGGFAKNDEMRKKYHQQPTDAGWSSVTENDTGEAIQAGIDAGAATALMSEAWWNPTFLNSVNGTPWISFGERGRPGSIIVDSMGKRFMNEAESYNDAGKHIYDRNKTVPAIPAWLVMDASFLKHTPLMAIGPRFSEKDGIRTHFLYKAKTLEELSQKINVDTPGLLETVERFNGFAKSGHDDDFNRGDTAADRMAGEPKVGTNPNLGPLQKAPYYAIRIYPGDIGTKGGLLTDEHARVLDTSGSPISGLYAAGNTSASVMGTRYAGAGATIGPAVVFAALAVDHAAGKKWQP